MAARFGTIKEVKSKAKQCLEQGAIQTGSIEAGIIAFYLVPEKHDVKKKTRILSCAKMGRGNWSFLYNNDFWKDLD